MKNGKTKNEFDSFSSELQLAPEVFVSQHLRLISNAEIQSEGNNRSEYYLNDYHKCPRAGYRELSNLFEFPQTGLVSVETGYGIGDLENSISNHEWNVSTILVATIDNI